MRTNFTNILIIAGSILTLGWFASARFQRITFTDVATTNVQQYWRVVTLGQERNLGPREYEPFALKRAGVWAVSEYGLAGLYGLRKVDTFTVTYSIR